MAAVICSPHVSARRTTTASCLPRACSMAESCVPAHNHQVMVLSLIKGGMFSLANVAFERSTGC